MFAKLGSKHALVPIVDDMKDILIRFGKTIDGEFYGYTTYKVCDDTAKQLLSFIPEEYHKGFEPCLIEINVPDLPPHVDNKILASINFYTDADEAVTTFYTTKPGQAIRVERLPNQTDGGIFVEEDLNEYASFTAQAGDAYILAIKQVHGVKGNNQMRRAYCLKSYDYTYFQILSMLNNYGLEFPHG
jgi:hypothetical protein